MPNNNLFSTLEKMTETMAQMTVRIQKMQSEIDGIKASQAVFEFFMSKVVPEVFSVDERAELETETLARGSELAHQREATNEQR